MTEKVSRSQAMLSMCHECMGHYSDTKEACTSPKCPLYTWMPYRKDTDPEPDLEWSKYNPKRSGKVLWEDSKREIDDETRAALVERMEKARAARKDVDKSDNPE